MSVSEEMIPLDGSQLPMPRETEEIGPAKEAPDGLLVSIHVRSNPDNSDCHDSPTDSDGYLSLDQFNDQFGASDADISAVLEYYVYDLGLSLNDDPDVGQCMVELRGSVEQCNEAFGVELNRYNSRRGRFWGHQGEILVPRKLSGIVESVSGLDSLVSLTRIRAEDMTPDPLEATPGEDSVEMPPIQRSESPSSSSDGKRALEERPIEMVDREVEMVDRDIPMADRDVPRAKRGRRRKRSAAEVMPARSADAKPPESWEVIVPTSLRRGLTSADAPGYFPTEIAKMYSFPETCEGVPGKLDGSGQTIAIIAMDGRYRRSDVDDYCRAQGVPPASEPYPEVIVGKQYNRTRNGPKQQFMSDAELTMDLQVAASLAPGAKLVIIQVEPKSALPYSTALRKYLRQLNSIGKPPPTIVSISYGMAEAVIAQQHKKSANEFFERITKSLGITICAASGDAGSATRDYDAMPPTIPLGPHVNFPASSPYVLGCGGTEIKTKDGKIVSEYAWNDHNQCRLATAGGRSTEFPRPDYQRDLDLPESPQKTKKFDGRGVPDVAGNASLNSGYKLLLEGMWGGRFNTACCGTSLVAPLYAALIARINQGLGRRVGFIHPYLYKLAGQPAIRDITEGSNGYYRSGVGWDACTGLGVVNGQALLDALKKMVPEKPGDPRSVDPEDGETTPSDLSTIVQSAAHSAFLAQSSARAAQMSVSQFRNPYFFGGR